MRLKITCERCHQVYNVLDCLGNDRTEIIGLCDPCRIESGEGEGVGNSPDSHGRPPSPTVTIGGSVAPQSCPEPSTGEGGEPPAPDADKVK